MANLARQSFQLEVHGTAVIVKQPGIGFWTCANSRQLWDLVVRGVLPPVKEEKPKLRTETVEEFLARGGVIQKVGFPPPPERQPEQNHSKLTLEDLGL